MKWESRTYEDRQPLLCSRLEGFRSYGNCAAQSEQEFHACMYSPCVKYIRYWGVHFIRLKEHLLEWINPPRSFPYDMILDSVVSDILRVRPKLWFCDNIALFAFNFNNTHIKKERSERHVHTSCSEVVKWRNKSQQRQGWTDHKMVLKQVWYMCVMLQDRTSYGLLWTPLWTFGFHKIMGICVAKQLLAFRGLSSVWSVSYVVPFVSC
jgi:hypothetical protein